jgi:hypothetical protein
MPLQFEAKEGRASIQEVLCQHLTGAKPADAVQRSLANLREVSAILNAKAPQDAAGFKTWLRAISQRPLMGSEGSKSAKVKRLLSPKLKRLLSPKYRRL